MFKQKLFTSPKVMYYCFMELELKFQPAYFSLIFSTVFLCMGVTLAISALINNDENIWLGIFIYTLIGGYGLYTSLKSIKKKIVVMFDGINIFFFYSSILGKGSNYTINLVDIERIFIYKKKINFITTTVSFYFRVVSENYKIIDRELFEVSGSEGFLSHEQRKKFIDFLRPLNPELLFGYVEI